VFTFKKNSVNMNINFYIGVAVAGESTSTSAAGDEARALERMAAGGIPLPIPPDAGGGGAGFGNDMLAAAAATAAAEMSIFTELANHAEGQPQQGRSNDSVEGNYGIYTKICKVAKKSGDSSVVFTVLGLVRRDPSYGSEGSDTEMYFKRYKALVVPMAKDKVRKLLPMLFMARFDPTPSIREVMRTLWTTLIPTEIEASLLAANSTDIFAYLSSNLRSKQWRERESACLALEMFIPQRPWSMVRPSLQQLWDAGMDVLDDIRDSTRTCALGFMKVLSNQV
jgi:hypothetical protein